MRKTAATAANLADHLACAGVDALAVHQASRRVSTVRATEQQDVRLRPVHATGSARVSARAAKYRKDSAAALSLLSG